MRSYFLSFSQCTYSPLCLSSHCLSLLSRSFPTATIICSLSSRTGPTTTSALSVSLVSMLSLGLNLQVNSFTTCSSDYLAGSQIRDTQTQCLGQLGHATIRVRCYLVCIVWEALPKLSMTTARYCYIQP